MILTGNSLVNERLHMTRSPRINGRSPLRKRDANRPSARQRIFDTASELFYLKGIRAVGVETIAAEADTTKMSLYRNFPSKDELVAEWLREHDANFWKTWDMMASRHPKDPRKQINAAFAVLAKHVADPKARGCPMANAAVELTERRNEDLGAVGALGEWCLAKLANVEPECHVDVEREVVFDRDSHDLVQPMLAFFLYFVHERG